MESSWLWFAVISACFGYIVKAIIQWLAYANKINKLPGPKPLPVLGNMNEMGFNCKAAEIFGLSCITNSIRYGLATLYRKEKLFRVWVGPVAIVCLHDADAFEPVMRSNISINKSDLYRILKPMFGEGLLTSSGIKWRTKRKTLTPSFHFQILEDYVLTMNEQANILTEKIKDDCDKEWDDVHSKISLCSLDIVCETAMGITMKAQSNCNLDFSNALHSAERAMIDRMHKFWTWIDFFYYRSKVGIAFKKDMHVVNSLTKKVIAQRKANRGAPKKTESLSSSSRKPRLSFLDLLLEAQETDSKMTEEELVGDVKTFITAGFDTISNAVAWTLYLIGLYPDVQKKLHEEIDYIFNDDKTRAATLEDIKKMKYATMVIKETKRIYPPIPSILRNLEEDIKVDGFTIPKGTDVYMNIYALHRNPEIFPDPEKFDPERFSPETAAGRNPYAYLPFAAGPRNCIGQRFAMMEERILLSFILRNFKMTSLDPRDSIPFTVDVALSPCKPLRMKFELREGA